MRLPPHALQQHRTNMSRFNDQLMDFTPEWSRLIRSASPGSPYNMPSCVPGGNGINVPIIGSNQMRIRCTFGQLGSGKGIVNAPHGFCLGLNEEIIVADTNNHKIQVRSTGVG